MGRKGAAGAGWGLHMSHTAEVLNCAKVRPGRGGVVEMFAGRAL